MPTVSVYNLKKEKVGQIDLADEVFGAPFNRGLLYEVLKAQLASRRSGSASTKNRSAVSGSTRKIYKQKGTGRSRHGPIRAPSFVGGGQAHGPLPRSYAYRPPAKMRVGALCTALSYKLKKGQLLVVDTLSLSSPKTKGLVEVLDALHVGSGSLIVDKSDNQNLRLSSRNLPSHQWSSPDGINLYDLLRHKHIVLTTDSARALEARCKK